MTDPTSSSPWPEATGAEGAGGEVVDEVVADLSDRSTVAVRVWPFTLPDIDPPSRLDGVLRDALRRDGRWLRLAEGADDADLLLFPDCHRLDDDWRLRRLREHELVRARPDDVVVYNERDRPWAGFPGLYVSMPASVLDRRRQAPVPYLALWQRIGELEPLAERDLLFSFVGSPTHACREDVFGLRHPRAVVERVEGFSSSMGDHAAHCRARFREVLRRSWFVLCPRGHGTSTVRIYEAMAAGSVPVVISDEWEPPPGPDWDGFALRWPEHAVAELPGVLEQLAPEAPPMGVRARAAYQRWCDSSLVLATGLGSLLARSARLGAQRDGLPAWFVDAHYRRLAAGEALGPRRHRPTDRAGAGSRGGS